MKNDKKFIAVFVIVALLSGWIGLLIDMVIPEQMEEQTLGMGIWLILPFLCGIVLRTIRKDWKDFGIRPRVKGNAKWYGMAILFFPAITLLFTLIAWTLGFVSFSSFSAAAIIPGIAFK